MLAAAVAAVVAAADGALVLADFVEPDPQAVSAILAVNKAAVTRPSVLKFFMVNNSPSFLKLIWYLVI
ncbi:hypothetical protein D3C87_2104900 [compost metagenome]